MSEIKELKLSDAFTHPDENFGIETYGYDGKNINYGKSKKLMEACRVLEEYSIFVARVRGICKVKYG